MLTARGGGRCIRSVRLQGVVHLMSRINQGNTGQAGNTVPRYLNIGVVGIRAVSLWISSRNLPHGFEFLDIPDYTNL